jgi:hypothetical protein
VTIINSVVEEVSVTNDDYQWVVGAAIKRIWFHPLSKLPGHPLWAASRIPYVLSLLRGTLNEDMLQMHQKYGDVIRLGPNELSFSTEQAWKDIYMYRPGHKETKKDPTWYIGKVTHFDLIHRKSTDRCCFKRRTICHRTS